MISTVLLTDDDSGGTPLSKTVKLRANLVPTGALVFRAHGAMPTDANWYAAGPQPKPYKRNVSMRKDECCLDATTRPTHVLRWLAAQLPIACLSNHECCSV